MTRHGLPFVLLLLAAAFAAAQPGPPPGAEPVPPYGGLPGPPPPPPGAPGPPGGPGMEGIGETVEIYRVHMMREALGLTEQQTLKMLDLGEKRRDGMRGIQEKRRDLMQRMGELVKESGAKDSDFRQALRDEAALREQERSLHEGLRKEAEAILTPRQQVQLLFFERRFEEEMRRRIEGLRGRGRQGAGPGAGPGMQPGRQERLQELKETNPQLYEEIRRRQEERRQKGEGAPADAPAQPR